jgi:hypothetical protein
VLICTESVYETFDEALPGFDVNWEDGISLDLSLTFAAMKT